MTDGYLMDADCIHGVAWYDCLECAKIDAYDYAAEVARLRTVLQWLIEHQGVTWWNGKVFAVVNGLREWVDAPAEVIEVLTEVDRGAG